MPRCVCFTLRHAGCFVLLLATLAAAGSRAADWEREGEFKIIGLKAGTYKLLVHPTANNYVDATINNIRVNAKEDSKVGTIILHK